MAISKGSIKHKKLNSLFYLFLVVLVSADFVVHKHGEFVWEKIPCFFGVYGIFSSVAFFFADRLLKVITKRKKDYYD